MQTFQRVSILFVLLGVPLILKLVPPNRLHGVRTGRTLADGEI